MNFKIEPVAPEYLPQLAALVKEFAEFEKLSHVCEVSEADLRAVMFGENAFVDCLVAFADKECVGYAIFYPIFKSFRGERSMFLEDLYVSPAMRGKGFGLKLLKAVAQVAKRQNCVRMDWQALKWNAPAVEFYKNLGAQTDDENLDFRLRASAFEGFASE